MDTKRGRVARLWLVPTLRRCGSPRVAQAGRGSQVRDKLISRRSVVTDILCVQNLRVRSVSLSASPGKFRGPRAQQ